ncbi:MAG: ABC transporter ATP-binding protein [Ruminococcaceae bacterium]|nr:ABC transporter ATP-binding protein [Oscillospiraceae bacterium]
MIKAEGIEKSYNGEKVLKGVNLEISDGEFVAVMGESGSGKSTLISILGGFLAADSGRVLWNGEDISKFSEKRFAYLRSTSVGFVFQFFKLIPTLNVRDNLLLPATLGGKINDETLSYMNGLVSELKLDSLLSKYPDQLSGGQCQRAAILRALIYKPSTVILDEPTGALDSATEEAVMKLLTRINKEQKATVIMVTHSKKVADYAHRIINLRDGDIVK